MIHKQKISRIIFLSKIGDIKPLSFNNLSIKDLLFLRIDKYIWSVRIYKTRTIARKSCSEGKVLLNNDPVKAGNL